MLVNINLSVVRPLSVPHAHMSKTKQNRQTRSYYGTLCRSWHRWLDCLVQILPRRGSGKVIRSGKDILVLNFKKICLNINTAFCSTWPQTTHSCCQPSSTDVTQQVLSSGVNGLRTTVGTCRPLCWWRQSQTRAIGGPASFHCAKFLSDNVCLSVSLCIFIVFYHFYALIIALFVLFFLFCFFLSFLVVIWWKILTVIIMVCQFDVGPTCVFLWSAVTHSVIKCVEWEIYW